MLYEIDIKNKEIIYSRLYIYDFTAKIYYVEICMRKLML